MRVIRIRVAGNTVEVRSKFLRSYLLCQDFAVDDIPIIYAECSIDDYDREAVAYESEYHSKAPSDPALEVTALLRKVAEGLVDYDVLLMHGAVIAEANEAFLFVGKSGVGKTTHINKWLDHLANAFVINGDKPFIKFHGMDPPLACGSPWAGKERMYTNTAVPLKSIILLERAEDNHIEQIPFIQAFPTLLQQTFRPDDEEKMRKTLHLMQRLCPTVTFWRFQCNNFKDDCFDVVYNALVRGQR